MKDKKLWSSLTRAEKRMAICKDALKQIALKKFIPKSDTYFQVKELNRSWGNDFVLQGKTIASNGQLNEVMKKTTCTVCAKGALFAADILERNHMTIIDGANVTNSSIASRLGGIFTGFQLDLIEVAFEKAIIRDTSGRLYVGTCGTEKSPIAKRAIAFGRKYGNATERLVAILKNIIKNKGEFKP